MRKLATTLLLAALPLAASAAPFDNWKDAHGPGGDGKHTLPYSFTTPGNVDFVFDTGFTTTTDVTLSFTLKYSDMWSWNNTTRAYESFGTLDVVYSDGNGGWTTFEVFGDSTWVDGVTINQNGMLIGPHPNTAKLNGPDLTLAAGTDFYFVLTVNGVKHVSNTAALHEYFEGFYPDQEGTLFGFDMGNGTFDNYVFMMGYTPGSVNLAQVVPEPETYAMMLAGLGMIGAVARRRKV